MKLESGYALSENVVPKLFVIFQVKLPEGQTGPVEFLADGSRLQPTISVIHGSHVGHVKLGSWSPKKGLTLTDKPEALPQIKAPGAITPAKEISVGGVLVSGFGEGGYFMLRFV